MTVKAQTQITHLTPSSPQIQPQPTTKLQSPLTHFIQLPKSTQLPHPHSIILPIEKFETLSNKYHKSYDTANNPIHSPFSRINTPYNHPPPHPFTLLSPTTPTPPNLHPVEKFETLCLNYHKRHNPINSPFIHPLPHKSTIHSPITPTPPNLHPIKFFYLLFLNF